LAIDSDFICALNFVKHTKDVKDTAERNVKLITDFATSITTDPAQQSALLQAVEHHRMLYPNLLKKNAQ